ncbi:hypothetical protein M6B38_360065 [Iris pallida]|uniref:Uncharacterized protein n=1 Tax=Iris pallida TaxID=29817 RepID=A0AAX6GLC5_IRIPA|nr:hypothetical protein M6B38_360065 [Iris pallida]
MTVRHRQIRKTHGGQASPRQHEIQNGTAQIRLPQRTTTSLLVSEVENIRIAKSTVAR